MTVARGFYRHYKGHLYFVHGVACLKHEHDRRVVIYTSVKTEQGAEGFDFLARDEADFAAEVGTDGTACARGWQCTEHTAHVPRFARVVDPERSKVP